MKHGLVPVARRQLLSEPAKVFVAVLAVGASVALVLLLTGLRRGMGEQVATYLHHQPPVLVGQEGTRNFLSQTSVLPDADVAKVGKVPGVAEVAPITQGYAMLALHGKHVLTVLIGYEPGSLGGPWSIAEGRAPRDGEFVIDETLASEHGLKVGSLLDVRGVQLPIVGLSRGTSGFMTPLAFTTRTTANKLNDQPDTATFLLVNPQAGVAPATLISRIDAAVPGISALERDELAARDRSAFVGAFSGPLTAMTDNRGRGGDPRHRDHDLFGNARSFARVRDAEGDRDHARRAPASCRPAVGRPSPPSAPPSASYWAIVAVRGVAAIAPKYLIALAPRDALAMALAALVFALLAGLVPARYLANLDPATAFNR